MQRSSGSSIAVAAHPLGEGIELPSQSELVLRTLGEHMFNPYIEIKRQEWDDYRLQVTPWELERCSFFAKLLLCKWVVGYEGNIEQE